MKYDTVNRDNIDRLIIENEKYVLIISSDMCQPCQSLKACLNELMTSYTDVKFGVARAEDNEELLDRFDTTGVPTSVLFKNGEIFDVVVGFDDIDNYKKNIDLLVGNISESQLITEYLESGELFDVDNQNSKILDIIDNINSLVILFTGCYVDDYSYMARKGEKLALTYRGRVVFLLIDQNDCVDIARKYQVPLLQPTLLLLKDGKFTDKIVGRDSRSIYKKAIERYL